VGAWRIALFFTGPKHAGENIAEVLKHRARELPAPIQMCDALSRNTDRSGLHHRPGSELPGAWPPAACRRGKFSARMPIHPGDVGRGLSERCAREQKLSPEERLRLHHEHSGPVMKQLQQ